MSCVCGADSGSDGPVRTADVETDDVDPVMVVSDMMHAQESSINKRIFKIFCRISTTPFLQPCFFLSPV